MGRVGSTWLAAAFCVTVLLLVSGLGIVSGCEGTSALTGDFGGNDQETLA